MSNVLGHYEYFGATLDRKAKLVTLIINLAISIIPLIFGICFLLTSAFIGAIISIFAGAQIIIPTAIILGRFAPRSYSVGSNDVTIHRKAGNIVIPLSSVESIRQCSYDDVWKDAAKVNAGSYRGYWGVFSSYVMHGDFLAYVTNTESIVLITRKNDIPVVISPDHPEEFINHAMRYFI